VGWMKELGTMLVQTMAVCFALVLTALLYCGSYLVERLREHTSFSVPGIDVDGFVMQAPEVLGHPYMTCSILMNTVSILWGLWSVVLV